ncbi:hypothetical protein DFH11DRAFT_515747 [Phellopilus nigrolimitatus]|nr:hypothetical protein DFH11DRAFT_515747 [Phellopilus nigrolimitatus]
MFRACSHSMSFISRCRPPSSPQKAPSPKRIFSTSQSRLLRALDSAALTVDLASATVSGGSPKVTNASDDPFGVEWPPKRQRVRSGTDGPGSSSSVPMFPSLRQPSTLPIEFSSEETASAPAPALLSAPEVFREESKENIAPERVQMSKLPLYSYKEFTPSPARVYVAHKDEADDLVGALSGPVGFDIEWRVIFRRNTPMRPAATVQLSDHKMILVIQVSAMDGFPKKLKEFLENPKIPKIGVNILNDGIKLARDYKVRPQGLVELGGLLRQADVDYVERYFRFAEPKPAKPAFMTPKANNTNSNTSIMSAKADKASEATPKNTPALKMRKPGSMISLAVVTAMYMERGLSKGPVRVSNWEARPLSEEQLEYAANDAHCALMVYDRLMDLAKQACVHLVPAKYTYDVFASVSAGAGKGAAGVKAPMLEPAPSISSAPSTSGSTSASSSTSVSRSTLSSCSSRPEQAVAPATGIATTDASDSDIEVLEIRDVVREPGSRKAFPPPPSAETTFMLASKPSSTKQVRQDRPNIPASQRPQHIRAYGLWHHKRLPVNEICCILRSKENPLKVGTVISYVVGALQADPKLPFEHARLSALLRTEPASWNRHKAFFENLDKGAHVNMEVELA